MAILLSILGILTLWLLSNIYTLYKNYLIARKCNLPMHFTPINPDNLIWMIFHSFLHPYLVKYLPAWAYEYIRPTFFGWEFRDQYKLCKRKGGSFLLVTPGEIEWWVGDAGMAQIILGRRKDFIQLPVSNKIIGFLGENLLTSNGETWARQRRLIAPNLNEKISASVWKESCEQATQMAAHLLELPGGETADTMDGLRKIAMNVLGESGYGQPKDWSMQDEMVKASSASEEEAPIFEAVSIMIQYLIPSAIIASWILRLPIFPKEFHQLAKVRDEYPKYTRSFIEKERSLAATDNRPRNNMAAMLVRLFDQGAETDIHGKPSASSQYLTEDEIRGNLFVFTAAGFDTTANTLGYSVALLAAYPGWQDWIQEELDALFPDQGQACDYNSTFPRLTRCLALMLETLRLYPPLMHISRSTAQSQTVVTAAGTHIIPAPAKVYINTSALATDPDVWGSDSTDFKPSRWIAPGSSIGEADALLPPPRGSYLPWSGGPRVCPGMKMAQVEFVAVIGTLFRRLRATPVVRKGESMSMTRARFLQIMAESTPILTLQINKPKDIVIRWEQR